MLSSTKRVLADEGSQKRLVIEVLDKEGIPFSVLLKPYVELLLAGMHPGVCDAHVAEGFGLFQNRMRPPRCETRPFDSTF